MREQRNRVKEFLDKSPWALGAALSAAVLSFVITIFDKGLDIYERLTPATPPQTSFEISGHSGPYLVKADDLRNLPVINAILKNQALLNISTIKQKERIEVWSVKLLALNPTDEKIHLHSCEMTVQEPNFKLPSISFGYFSSNSINPTPKHYGKIIPISPKEARKVDLIFVFSDLRYKKHQPLSLFDSGEIAISCRDQNRRLILAKYPIYSKIEFQVIN